MKKLFIVIFALVPIELFAQDYKSRYENLYAESKFNELLPLLTEWEESEPKNPEMFIAAFNYYLHESKQEGMKMDAKPGLGANLVFSDTITGEPVGYLYGDIHYDDELFDKAQNYLIEGIKLNPSRLDMYFGRIYSLRERGALEEHVSEIINVINRHTEDKPIWLWSNNKRLDDSENLFKGSIQNYNYEMFNLETPYLMGIRRVSEEMLKHYPQDVVNYFNLGLCYFMEENWNEALLLFERIPAKDSKVPLLLSNMAYCYQMLGDYKTAIKYYKKFIVLVGDEEGDYAKKQIEYLKVELKKDNDGQQGADTPY